MHIFSVVFFLSLFLTTSAQKKKKVDDIPFCGVAMGHAVAIREVFGMEFDFLNVKENDTIVDIGASSGWLEGALSAVSKVRNVLFVLVDIDSACLNREKVSNMVHYYSAVKKDSITNTFSIVRNTPDSLWLPAQTYSKVWLLNTLHELPLPPKMARDIAWILRPNGELCVVETLPKKEGQLHPGCNRPLLTAEEIEAVFLHNGFRLVEKKLLPEKKRFTPVMYRFVKE